MELFNNTFTLAYPSKANRIDLYDFLRGIAMLLVLYHHAKLPGKEYVLTFHMPLFFFLSGFVSSGRTIPWFGDYFIIRFKRLMIPYFVFGVLYVIGWYAINTIVHHHYDFHLALLGVITGVTNYVPVAQNGIFWFLFVLFMADMMTYPINKFLNNSMWAKLGGAILFMVMSYVTTHYATLTIFTLDKSFMAASFILFGSYFKPFCSYYIENDNNLKVDVAIIVLACIGVWLSENNNDVNVLMYKNQYGNYPCFFLGAFCGIIATLLIGKYLYKWLRYSNNFGYTLIMWVGFNSLVLFPVHIMVKVFFAIPVYNLFFPIDSVVRSIIVFITMLLVSIPICNFITNYMPWMLGMKKITY